DYYCAAWDDSLGVVF
nr:immunoglobulin light chain junction region [Macaca mulatta]